MTVIRRRRAPRIGFAVVAAGLVGATVLGLAACTPGASTAAAPASQNSNANRQPAANHQPAAGTESTATAPTTTTGPTTIAPAVAPVRQAVDQQPVRKAAIAPAARTGTSTGQSGTPAGLASVPGCSGICYTEFDIALPAGGRFVGLLHEVAGEPGVDTGFLAYWVDGRLVSYLDSDTDRDQVGDVPLTAQCDTSGTVRCAVAFQTGAHSVLATLLTASPSSGITVTDVAPGDGPYVSLADLNHDGVIDAAVTVNDYDPDYATGARGWKTLLADNGKFTMTGCTALSRSETPAPTSPATGPCPEPY